VNYPFNRLLECLEISENDLFTEKTRFVNELCNLKVESCAK